MTRPKQARRFRSSLCMRRKTIGFRAWTWRKSIGYRRFLAEIRVAANGALFGLEEMHRSRRQGVQAGSLGERFRAILAASETATEQRRHYFTRPEGDFTEPQWVFDAPRDRAFAQPDHPAFARTLSVFTQEWVGIRAAAGSFPGMKLAISKQAAWTAPELRRVFQRLQAARIETVVCHGASSSVLDFLQALRIAMPELTIVGVWHGTLAAWSSDEEHALASRFLDLATNGVFDRISLLRRGMYLLHPKAVTYLTPNLPPSVDVKRLAPAMSSLPLTCIFAGWNNQWKNMYANLVAASSSACVGRVLSYAAASLPAPLGAKLDTLPYGTRRQHLVTLSGADLALNVTTVDCHPMIELEAIAVGTPVLRGQLDLDFGGDHAYSRLLTVESPLDPVAIRERLEAVAQVPAGELSDIVADYRRTVIETAFARYGEFLKGAR
jgi:hypothetical protein